MGNGLMSTTQVISKVTRHVLQGMRCMKAVVKIMIFMMIKMDGKSAVLRVAVKVMIFMMIKADGRSAVLRVAVKIMIFMDEEDEWEECSSESGESSDIDADDIHTDLQFVEDRRETSTAEISKHSGHSQQNFSDTSRSTRQIRTIRRKQLKEKEGRKEEGPRMEEGQKKEEGRKREEGQRREEGRKREDEMSEDTLEELQKQRKERAAIIGQTRVRASVGCVCVCGGGGGGWLYTVPAIVFVYMYTPEEGGHDVMSRG